MKHTSMIWKKTPTPGKNSGAAVAGLCIFLLALLFAGGIALILQPMAYLEKQTPICKARAPTNISSIACGLTVLLTCCHHKCETLGVSVKLFCDTKLRFSVPNPVFYGKTFRVLLCTITIFCLQKYLLER